ncbi:phage portal protein [Limosilactobacillus reuteri]|uniref:Phage portal protein n=1 Tax=Limosilactobacillus reuteri TaxID=1598 RepID=A0A1C2G9U1_LIMRT|nr:phage portal protein [Limosilactobacillus reuteri]OCX48195.1 phage portal protein [Limosilactobacillus reuteri]WPC93094.1 phage portal protein [Limosilactobacillus reuteri]
MEKYLNERCIVSEDDVFYYNSDDDITRADVMRFILENETLSSKYASYGRYYKAKHDKIMNAPKKPNNKPDNRLILNYPKKLVDTYTGFAVGKPVQITLQEDMANKALSEFNQTRNIDTLLAKVWKESAIYGRAYFYVYGANKEIYVTDATPMDCFIIYDNTVAHEPLYAVRYAKVGPSQRYQVTIYSNDYQYNFESGNGRDGLGDRKQNPFHIIPIIEVVENDERLSVIANVKTLIDELDKSLSEKANDVDYFADAYMKVLGALLTDEQIKQLRDMRIINLKSSNNEDEQVENLDVDFLSKPNADETQENLINRIVDNLYQISMIVNLNDKDFGNSTGVALEMKYKPMMNLATLKGRMFTRSIKQMYKVIFASDLIKQVDADTWKDLDINYQFDLPHDTLTEAQTAQALANLGISRLTWLKTISAVNDPKQEEENMDAEKQKQLQQNYDFLKGKHAVTDGEANDNSSTGKEENRAVTE